MLKVNHHEQLKQQQGGCYCVRVKQQVLKETTSYFEEKNSFLQESSHSVRSFSGDPKGFSS